MSRTLLATLACVVAAACWAANAVIAAGAFELGVTPERLAQARVVVALVPLAAYLLVARRDLLRPPRAAVPALIGFGACIVAVNFSYYVAIDRVPVGVAVALQYTAPVLVLAGTAVIARRSPQATIWLAGALSLVGAVLVSGALAGAQQTLDGLGLLAGVAAALTFAGYLVTAELAGRRGTHPVTTLFIGFCVAAVIWTVVLPLWNWPIELFADPQIAWRVVAVGLLGTLLPFGLVVAALRWISSALAGIAATAEPVLAALLAWLFLGQVLSVPQLIGGALVIAGVLIAQMARQPEPEAIAVEMTP
jgi:drug/metabolite transporter (DMT)-like permease